MWNTIWQLKATIFNFTQQHRWISGYRMNEIHNLQIYNTLIRNTKICLNIKKSERKTPNLRLAIIPFKGMDENRWKGYIGELQGSNILYLNLDKSIQIFNVSFPFTPHTYFIKILVASQLSCWTIKQSPKHTHMHTLKSC